MFGMLLGRLEIFIVLIGIYSGVTVLKQKVGRKAVN
jgi:trk system potassium uptake protein TrkH